MWKIWFRKVKSKVSSTGKFHFGLPKKQKIGLSYTDFVIYLCNKWLQENNPHWNLHWNPHWTRTGTRTGTRTEKYRFGGSGQLTLVSKNQVMMTWMKRTIRMVWWLFQRFQLQRYNKKQPFPNFRDYLPPILRQSVMHVKNREHYGALIQETSHSCWKDSNNCRC